MDYKGQTAVLLSIFVLVGMIFLVPAITEKALAVIFATARCDRPCHFTLVGKTLDEGRWDVTPTASGDTVKWTTTGNPQPGNEKGSVTYDVSFGSILSNPGPKTAVLSFESPVSGRDNKCDINLHPTTTQINGSCEAGKGLIADFTYTIK